MEGSQTTKNTASANTKWSSIWSSWTCNFLCLNIFIRPKFYQYFSTLKFIFGVGKFYFIFWFKGWAPRHGTQYNDTWHNNTQHNDISIKTLSIMALSIMALSITKFLIMTQSKMTLSIKTLGITTLNIMIFSIIINKMRHSTHWQSIVIPSVINVGCHLCCVTYKPFMLSVVMLRVVAPSQPRTTGCSIVTLIYPAWYFKTTEIQCMQFEFMAIIFENWHAILPIRYKSSNLWMHPKL